MTDKRVFPKDLEDYFRIGERQARRRFGQIRGFCGIGKYGIVRWSHVKEFETALNKGDVATRGALQAEPTPKGGATFEKSILLGYLGFELSQQGDDEINTTL